MDPDVLVAVSKVCWQQKYSKNTRMKDS